jgi:2-methylcitrate dehydratase PrpD
MGALLNQLSISAAIATDLSKQLARYVADIRFEDLPPGTVLSAKRALADGIGVMLAASGMSADIAPFVASAKAMGGAGPATILGSWERVQPAAAAFANGAMAHALDFEDAFDAAPTHPNASLIPAALATAQSLGDVSGKDFILAMAVGCDLACRIALSAGDALESSPWYPPPILGALGTVAAAAKLRRLTPQQINDAFSLMLCQTACPGEIKHSEHTVIRAIREAFPAQAAVISVLLAAQNVRGFDAPLEGRGGFYQLFAKGQCDTDALLQGLGQRFYIDELSFKLWPSCRGTHPYIEAAQRLRTEQGVLSHDIKTIRAAIGPVQRMLSEPLERKRAPATAIDAKFSIPFTVASAFIQDEVTLDSFAAEQLGNRNVLALAQRVEPRFREGVSATSGAIEVELANGTTHACTIEQALGHPERPLDAARLRAKFLDCARRAARPMSQAQAAELFVRIMTIDTADDFTTGMLLPAS